MISKEVINQKQATVMMSTFIIGSTAVLGVGSRAKQDVWIAFILATVMAGIIFIVYGRILKLFPGKGLYEILESLFGKVMGKIISLLFIWYAFHLGALVIRNITEFMTTISLPETPICIIAFFVSLLVIWAVRGGIELIGRWISIFFPIMILFIFTITLLTSPIIDFKNLKPILYNGLQPVINTAFDVFAFPFAETILFITILGGLAKSGSSYKVYFLSLLIGGGIVTLIAVRNVLVLGAGDTSISYFASYSSTRLINIGNFLQRIEVTVSIVFITSAFIKCCVCLFAFASGVARIFNIKDYHRITAPLGLLMAIFSITIYKSTMEMFEWAANYYMYYAIPFQIILPVAIWITAEIKTRIAKNNANAKGNANTNISADASTGE